MAPDVEREILDRVRMDRRGFVRRVVATTAFATPVLASFDMRSMTAYADCFTPNQTVNLEDSKFAIKLLSCKKLDNHRLRIRLRVRDADSGKNVSREGLKVKLVDVTPDPPGEETQRFDLKDADGDPFYQLKLDTSGWSPDSYELNIRVGDDHFFQFSILVD